MALTVSQYKARMKQAIGNADPATGFTLLEILNESLRDVYGYAEWSWKTGAPASIDFVANTAYAALPTDFGTGQLLSVHSPLVPIYRVIKTTLDDIAAKRGLIVSMPMTTYVAVSWPSQLNSVLAPGQARLEIWPTPSTSRTGAITITYRRGPATLTSDSQVPNIPVNFESALTSWARAQTMLRELGASDQGAVAEYNFAKSQLDSLKEQDGAQDSDLGLIQGAVMGASYDPLHFDPTLPIPGRP